MTDEPIRHANFAEALVAFQGDMPHVGKGKSNPFFNSKYADLASIAREATPLMAKHGLSFSAGGNILEGEWVVSGTLRAALEGGRTEDDVKFFPMTGNKPQEFGSAITYARRYLMCSMLGIVADEDDDANVASGPGVTRSRARQSRPTPPALNQEQAEAGLQEILACSTKGEALAAWGRLGFDGAPADLQAKGKSHGASLPE